MSSPHANLASSSRKRTPTAALQGLLSTVAGVASTPLATGFIVAIAVAARIVQLVFFYNMGVDASYQVLATENFVNGKGITLAAINPADFSEVVYQPLINWPPGYTLLLAPFYLLFGRQYIPAAITLDIALSLVFIFANRALLRCLGCTVAQQNACTLVNGLFIYHFYFIASSDGLAAAVFSVLLYVVVLLLQDRVRLGWSVFLLTALSLLCALLKYLFVPVVFVTPFFLFLAGVTTKRRTLRLAGLWTFGLLLAIVSGLLLYQLSLTGRAGYISATQRGLFFSHLLDTYPFLVTAFLKPDTIGQLTHLPTQSGSLLFRLFTAVNLALVLYTVMQFVRKLTPARLQRLNAPEGFYLLSLLLSVAVFTVLAILSLQVAKEDHGYMLWTYVQEPRYYGLVVTLAHLAVFVFYRHHYPTAPSFRKVLFTLLCVLLVVETARGVFFTLRRLRNVGREEYSWQYEKRFQEAVGRAIDSVKKQYPRRPVIVTGTSYVYNHRFSLQSHVPMLNEFGAILESEPFSSTPVVVVSVIDPAGVDPRRVARGALGQKLDSFEKYAVYVRPVGPPVKTNSSSPQKRLTAPE